MKTKPTKYTEDFVIKELKTMYSQLLKSEEVVYINQLFSEKSYSRQRFSEWKKDFVDCSEITDTIKKIEEVLESRLVVGGLLNKLNPTMAIFTLKNKYSWSNAENKSSYNNYYDVIKRDVKKYFR